MIKALSFATAMLVATTTAHASETAFLEVWDMDADGKVTMREVDEMRIAIFETFDKDGDGALNSEEYTAFDKARGDAAKDSNSPLLKRAVHGLRRESMDTNLDGMVTRNDMSAALRDWFMSHDKDKDGVLTDGDF